MADQKDNKSSEQGMDPTRRRFLKNTGLVIGGVAGGSLLGGLLVNQQGDDSKSGDDGSKASQPTEARMFFTRHSDFVVLEQATERIYPEDDNGPGAIGLGVPYFIDKQLAGAFGSNRNDYTKPPGREPKKDVNTYQTLMTRGDVFLTGLRTIDAESNKRHNQKFKDLEGEQQDEILQDIDDEKIKLNGVSSKTFFDLLVQMTIEGAYADPLYGGNKNMEGWKMREYPGARASYTDLIDSEEFQVLDPISLTDYQP